MNDTEKIDLKKEKRKRETSGPVGLHKRSNIYFIRILKGDEKEAGLRKYSKKRKAETDHMWQEI